MKLVRKGDALSPYGGEVTEGRYSAFGPPLAYQGAAAQCEKHGATQIAEGAELFCIDGQPVALEGCSCDCGCTVQASLPSNQMDALP